MKKVRIRQIRKKPVYDEVHGAYITQAITQADSKGEGDIAIPDDSNVKRARDWVNENKK